MKRLLVLLMLLTLCALPALAEATPTPGSPEADADATAAITAADSFFYFWYVAGEETQLSLTAPSWRDAQEDPQAALARICAGQIPAGQAEILSVSGKEGDVIRSVRVKVPMYIGDMSAPQPCVFTMVVLKEDSEWYVDPRSVAVNTAPTVTPAPSRAATPTPVPAPRPAPGDTPLYYNPDGGSKYHADPHCGAVAARYLPLSGVFTYGQLDEALYADLKPCAYCAAPQPPAGPTATAIPVYVDGMLTEGYIREEPIDMPSGADYSDHGFIVGTAQGDSFRTNAAVGSLKAAPASLGLVWIASADAPEAFSFLSSVQPVIVQWPREVRAGMALTPDARNTIALKEVILPGMDGRIRFLNLADGSLTRPAIDIGYPIGSAVTLHPLCYPLMLAGQYNAEAATTATVTGHSGLRYIELTSGVTVRFVDGEAAIPAMIPQSLWGGFNTSPLIDQNTNTAVFLSDDGWLFTEQLSFGLYLNGERADTFLFDRPQSVAAQVSAHYITADPVMYGSRLWLGNEAGQVICVDTSTMQPLWTAGGFRHVSALALEATGDEGQLRLWIIADISKPRLVALDPDTGDVLCDIPLNDDDTWRSVASQPMIGTEGLSGLAFVTVSEFSGRSAIVAVDTEMQTRSWRVGYPDCSTVSAPVAVYDDEGNGYVIAAFSDEPRSQTTLLLLEGRTGVILNTLTIGGSAPCDPAVYGDMLVIATSTAGGGHVYGIRLSPAEDPAPQPDSSESIVNAFMTAWASNDLKAMLDLCAPSWVNAQANASVMLFAYRANRIPATWECAASADGVALRVCLDRNDGSSPEWHSGSVVVTEEDGQRWIDPGFILDLVPEE